MKRALLNEHISSILYLAGTSGYTTIYFADRKPRLYAYPLIRFVEIMPTLIRTHRTYLVNPDHVAAFHYQGLLEAYVVVGGQKLPVSRRRTKAVYSTLHSFSALAVKKSLNQVLTYNQSSRLPLLKVSSDLPPIPSSHQATNQRLSHNFSDEGTIER